MTQNTMKPRVIIFGIGSTCKFFFENYSNEYEIIGLSDWDKSKHGSYLFGYEILNPFLLDNYDFDFIIIMSFYIQEIKKQLIERIDIDEGKIRILDKYPVRLSDWSIGVYSSNERFVISKITSNPIITRDDLNEFDVLFVADPFVFCENGIFYLFYEVMVIDSTGHEKGIINVANSNDGMNFKLMGKVLEDMASVSFPIVFKHGKDYYMTVHSKKANNVRLFKAVDFPFTWFSYSILLNGPFCDPVLIYKESTYYLFTSIGDNSLLFFSDNLIGPYIEHNKSPIVLNDKRIARNAGKIFSIKNQLYRPVQDSSKMFGEKVRLMKIIEISRENYVEKECSHSPVLKAGEEPWRSYRMHTLNIYDLKEDGTFKVITDGDNIQSQSYRLVSLKDNKNLKIKTL